MKKIYSILAGLLMTASVFAQVPEKMSYQAVVRNGSNALVVSTPVGMQISVLQGSSIGTAVYVETQTPSTNANGLVSLEIGTGVIITGTFAAINWANGPYFIKTETDPTGGTNYTITGTSQLLSVPFALHTKTAENGISTAQTAKLAGIETGAEVNVNADWNATSGDAQILNKPTILAGTAVGQMQYWNGTAWVVVAPPSSNGKVLYYANNMPQWGVIVGPTDVMNFSTGKTWMDRNLGATQVATNNTDAASYGDLYQWGRRTDGHQIRTSTTTTTLSTTDIPGNGNYIVTSSGDFDWRSPQNTNLWQGVNGINNPCPIGYRLPTQTELNNERLSWSTNNAAGAFASPLKLPLAGYRNSGGGTLFSVNTAGYYWSSTINATVSNFLLINSTNSVMSTFNRATALSVRCIKD
jgi:uncharacterized protein (TIGR02145 family)